MALVSLGNVIAWPGMARRLNSTPSVVTLGTVDAAGEYAGFVAVAREAMTISHVGIRTSTVAGSPTADVRIETVAADGTPSGTLWATNTNIITGTLTSNTSSLHALTASASISAGQSFAVIVKANTGTSFIIVSTNNIGWDLGNPYSVVNSGTVAKAAFNTTSACFALGSNSTTFYHLPGLLPITTGTANAFNNTNSAKRGVRFQVPFPCRCVGIRVHEGTTAGDKNAALFNDAGTELSSSTAVDGNYNAGSAAASQHYYFDNPVSLSTGTWYRAAIEPTSATNCQITTVTLPTADYRTACPGGTNYFYTTFASGSWTDTATTQVPLMDILIDQVEHGVQPTYQMGII